MNEMKTPEIKLGEIIEETVFDNSEIRTERITLSAFADEEGYFRSQEEGEWLSAIKGRAVLTVGDKRVELVSPKKVFIPSKTPYRYEESDELTMLLAVFHK